MIKPMMSRRMQSFFSRNNTENYHTFSNTERTDKAFLAAHNPGLNAG